jgi:hypothetical protein
VTEQLGNTFYKADVINVDINGASFPDAALCKRTGVPGQNNVCGQYLVNPDKFSVRNLKDLNVQVWVLKTDGTALKEKLHPGGIDFTVCNAGSCTDGMIFVLEHAAPSELAAVVVRADGKLLVRDIQADR